jgi:hypothetical protein
MKKKHAKKHIQEELVEVQEEPVEEVVPESEESSEPDVPVMQGMPTEPQPDKHKKVAAIWLAVGGSMAIIIVLWFLLLPMQIGDLRLPSAKDLARWHTLAPAADTARSFGDNLKQIQDRLGQLTNSAMAPTPAKQATTVIDIELLRQKLEAASRKIESQATNTNEAKK